MREKERFSAPRNSLDSIMRFSAGNAGFTGCGKLALYQRTTFSRAINAQMNLGFTALPGSKQIF
jgi:hypothetical protein